MIQKEITRQQKVTIYRAFYNKASDVEVADKFKVLLRPQGTESIAWVASEEEHTDLLIGRFEDYDMNDVEEFAEWLRPDNPRLGTEVVRGGQFVEIPVRHPLSVMVADGYAAIGDSAFMTVPLIGSGIANSLKAARILAETVINDPTQGFGVEALWKYQVLFFKHLGTGLAPLECVKNLMFKFTPEDLDYCFTSGILTDYNVTMTANFGSFYDVIDFFDVNDLLNKAKQACSDITFLKKFINAGNKISLVTAACLAIPRRWDRKLVEIWAKGYDKAF
jgi:flavin-dependent dehydrogenase